ncbi:MAG: leukotoxin secretion protein D [Methylococcaceae bacterium]|nr:leukotoxin secretion protein D [Methylococcaceae bacterium]
MPSAKKRGVIYSAKVQPTRYRIRVEDQVVSLAPEMAVTVEIKIGHPRMIESFLSPLIQHAGESLQER